MLNDTVVPKRHVKSTNGVEFACIETYIVPVVHNQLRTPISKAAVYATYSFFLFNSWDLLLSVCFWTRLR